MIAATREIAPAQRGAWAGRTSASFLDEAIAARGDRPMVHDAEVTLSFAEVGHRADALAAGLRDLGVGAGDVVLVQLPNWWEAVVVHQALMRLGAVCCPVVPIYRTRELAFILAQARPVAVVTPHVFRRHDHAAMFAGLVPEGTELLVVRPEGPLLRGARDLADVAVDGAVVEDAAQPGDVCMLMYTSGTTADPKGVLHSHETLVHENQTIIDLAGLGEDDVVFMPSPVTHITGFLYGLLLPAMLQAPVVLLDVWDAGRAVELVAAHGATFTVGATPFLQGIVDVHESRGDTSSLRLFLCGGADVPPALVRRADRVMGCAARVYGSTEFPTACSGAPDDVIEVRADSDGRLIGAAEARVRDEVDGVGQLEVRGPEMFLGYLDAHLNEDAFTTDGWFRTGDLASIEGGAITIRGRSKDIIVRGGENISAKEVEDLLYLHADVEDVAVVAMPDPVMVERACAFVVPREGTHPDVESLGTWLGAQGLATQKRPERVELVDELPRTASGKIQKFVLRDRLRADLEVSGPA